MDQPHRDLQHTIVARIHVEQDGQRFGRGILHTIPLVTRESVAEVDGSISIRFTPINYVIVRSDFNFQPGHGQPGLSVHQYAIEIDLVLMCAEVVRTPGSSEHQSNQADPSAYIEFRHVGHAPVVLSVGSSPDDSIETGLWQ